jgi:hypothetical protein
VVICGLNRALSADGGSPKLNLKLLAVCNVSYSVTNVVLFRLLSGNVMYVMYVSRNTSSLFVLLLFPDL